MGAPSRVFQLEFASAKEFQREHSANLVNGGVFVRTEEPATAREMGLRASAQGAIVTKVDPDSPASEYAGARLYPGDVIYRIDTRFGRFAIRSAEDYARVMLMQPAAIKLAVATKEGTREYFLKR